MKTAKHYNMAYEETIVFCSKLHKLRGLKKKPNYRNRRNLRNIIKKMREEL